MKGLRHRTRNALRLGGRALSAAALLLSAFLSVHAAAAEEADGAADLRAQVDALKAECETLRKENQSLRRELVARRTGGMATTNVPVRVEGRGGAAAAGEASAMGYWLSSKSRIRHNPRCRNFGRVKGRPCKADEGRPCKTCGG